MEDLEPKNLGSQTAAIRQVARWGMTLEMRNECIEKLMKALKGATNTRDIANCVKTAAMLEAQNQTDEHAAKGLGEFAAPVKLDIFLHDQKKEIDA